MVEKKHFKKQQKIGNQAQAIVEFAIVLPILLLVLVGIFEVGRYLFIYSAATNASRNAVRYASAVGLNDAGLTKYNYCDGIRETAYNAAFLVPESNLNITIKYDEGPGTSEIAECNEWTAGLVDTDVSDAGVSSGDRVTVTVTAGYKPMLNMIPVTPRTITSTSSRTILGVVDLVP